MLDEPKLLKPRPESKRPVSELKFLKSESEETERSMEGVEKLMPPVGISERSAGKSEISKSRSMSRSGILSVVELCSAVEVIKSSKDSKVKFSGSSDILLDFVSVSKI